MRQRCISTRKQSPSRKVCPVSRRFCVCVFVLKLSLYSHLTSTETLVVNLAPESQILGCACILPLPDLPPFMLIISFHLSTGTLVFFHKKKRLVWIVTHEKTRSRTAEMKARKQNAMDNRYLRRMDANCTRGLMGRRCVLV